MESHTKVFLMERTEKNPKNEKMNINQMFLSNYISKIKIKKMYIMNYFTYFLRIKIGIF